MTDQALVFNETDKIGQVVAVDTTKVLIEVNDPDVLTRATVGNLIAIKGSTENEYLIAITDKVTRSLKENLTESFEEISDEFTLELSPDDKLIGVLIGTYKIVEGDETDIFKRGADSFPQIDRACFFIEGSNLQRFMNLLGKKFDKEKRLKLGHYIIDPSAEAIVHGDKFFQRHAAILGSTGSGKSWTVALLLERANQLKYSNIIVMDMHGEYTPFTSKENGIAEGFKIAGPGELDKPDDNILFLPYWLLNRDEMLSMLLDRSDQNAPNQASRFTLHIRDLKKKTLDDHKKTDVLNSFTVDSPIPYDLKELVNNLRDDDTRKGVGAKGQPVKGEWEGKLTRFISRFNAKTEDRRYGFLFQPPSKAMEYDWLSTQIIKMLGLNSNGSGIKIIDFSEVPSDILPVVAGTFARLLYDIQFWIEPKTRTPYTLLCDEAHLYLPVKDDADAVQKQALGAFERIAKEGRKHGVSIVVVSQRPSDVSRTILSQCNNFLSLRLTNDRDQSVIKRLMPDSLSSIVDLLPLLDIGEGIILGDSVLLPTRIKIDKPKIKPDSATRNFWTEWANKEPNIDAIKNAVETLRRQTRAKNENNSSK